MKILVAVLACDEVGYRPLEQGVRETWGSDKSKHENIVDIIYYYGDYSVPEHVGSIFEGDNLKVHAGEGYFNTWNKTLMMYDFIVKNYEFDCLFRTNVSSYIDLKILQDFCKKHYNENFYSGAFGDLSPGNFCSGSGYFLSRKLVEEIASEKENLYRKFVDDFTVGEILRDKGVIPFRGERYDATQTFDIVSSNITDNSSTNREWGTIDKDIDHYHYRVHTTPVGQRSDDIKKMHFIHELKNKV